MTKRQNRIETASDGAEKLLSEMVGRFSVKRAVDWVRVKFPSFDTSHGEPLECAATKNEKDYFAEAQLLGFVGRLPDGDLNRPLVVAAIKMKRVQLLWFSGESRASDHPSRDALQRAGEHGAAEREGLCPAVFGAVKETESVNWVGGWL